MTSTDYWCFVCNQPIVGFDIARRHSSPDGEDVHEKCCEECKGIPLPSAFEDPVLHAKYVKRPTFCPYCGHNNIKHDDGDIDIHGKYSDLEADWISRQVGCGNCNKFWNEIYELTAIEEIKNY